MSKKLVFQYNSKEYKLAYTIDVLRRLDRNGALAAIVNGERPLTMTEDLFLASFDANHADVSTKVRRNIYEQFSESSEDGSLLECLLEMVNETRELMAPKGNVKWGMEE